MKGTESLDLIFCVCVCVYRCLGTIITFSTGTLSRGLCLATMVFMPVCSPNHRYTHTCTQNIHIQYRGERKKRGLMTEEQLKSVGWEQADREHTFRINSKGVSTMCVCVCTCLHAYSGDMLSVLIRQEKRRIFAPQGTDTHRLLRDDHLIYIALWGHCCWLLITDSTTARLKTPKTRTPSTFSSSDFKDNRPLQPALSFIKVLIKT